MKIGDGTWSWRPPLTSNAGYTSATWTFARPKGTPATLVTRLIGSENAPFAVVRDDGWLDALHAALTAVDTVTLVLTRKLAAKGQPKSGLVSIGAPALSPQTHVGLVGLSVELVRQPKQA